MLFDATSTRPISTFGDEPARLRDLSGATVVDLKGV